MAMGMSYEEYWYGDVRMTKSYVEAFRLKKEQENEQFWIQGMYFYDGLCCALSNAFSKRGSKKAEYPKKPYQLYEHKKTEAEKQREIEAERKRAHDYLDSIVKSYKRQREGREIIKPM